VRPDGELQPVDLVNRVDKALYQAKDDGRNAIAVA
jgi:PleD family two-component response regulator